MKPYRTWEECEQSYPLLICVMQWVAILSSSEAACAIRDWVNRAWYKGQVINGEAVEHYGGSEKLLKRAWQSRHEVMRYVRHYHLYRAWQETRRS